MRDEGNKKAVVRRSRGYGRPASNPPKRCVCNDGPQRRPGAVPHRKLRLS